MRRIAFAVLAAAAAACDNDVVPTVDAAVDLVVADAPPSPPDKAISLSVDFTIEGCPAFVPDPTSPSCTGKAPLSLVFVPLATTVVNSYRWNFGDGSATDGIAPSHTFTTPGVYTVNLIAFGVTGSVVARTHADFVVVEPNGTGERCASDAQCGTGPQTGTFCLCQPAEPCSNGVPHGMCTSECLTSRCGDDEVCADLLTTEKPLTPTEPWQTALCLAKCSRDEDCRQGLRCRSLPPGQSGAGWVRGCFADIPREVGEPCTDAAGRRRDDFCASGLCLDVGSLGMCSMNCEINACPAGSDCVSFGDGPRLCFRPCSGTSSFACDRDPLLGCVVPTAGALGYQLPSHSDTAFASSYCAPKACTAGPVPADDPCLPTGTCTFAGGGRHCVRR